MKKNLFLPALLLSFLAAGYLHAESIVMKSTIYGLEALSDEDIKTHGQVVSEILLKYSWPMCQDSDLTPKEQHELLSAEGNEQRFLERKLNETIPASERDFEFVVIFVPTTLYELFCISEKDELYPRDAIAEANEKIRAQNIDEGSDAQKYEGINEFPYVGANPFSTISDPKRLSKLFQQWNQSFYPYAILKSHQLFARIVCFTRIKHYSSDKINVIISNLIQEMTQKNLSARRYSIAQIESQHKIMLDYINRENEAHEINKGLISRASKLLKNEILASTRRFDKPYSISFGGSLFAGFIRDTGACVFDFLRKENSDTVGYTIFIDKQKYYQDKIDNLFLIPGLSTLASLFAHGEFFHPRAKATIKNSSINEHIQGIGMYFTDADKARVLTLKRDPLEHEVKFLKYFIDNFKISHLPPNETLTLKEKQANILTAQKNALVETEKKLLRKRLITYGTILVGASIIAAIFFVKNKHNKLIKKRITALARYFVPAKLLAPAVQDLTSAKL